jgi:hypothetical protein
MNDTALPPVPQNNIYGPITPSQMLERTAALLRENFKLFFGIVLVVIGVEIVIGGIMGGSALLFGRSTMAVTQIARALVIIPVSLVGAAIIYIIAQIIQGGLFIATDAKLAGAPMSVGQACSVAAEKTGRLVGIAILIALRVLGYVILFWIAAIALFAIFALAAGGFSRATGSIAGFSHSHSLGFLALAIVYLLVVLVLYVLLLFYLAARYASSIPAALAENLGVTDAIRRSIYLSRDNKGRLYILFLVVACIYIGLAAVTFPVQMMYVRGGLLHPAAPTLATEVVTMLLALFRIVVSGFVVAIVGIATALCYYDLRVRKEGFGNSPAVPVAVPPAPVWPPASNVPAEDFPIS